MSATTLLLALCAAIGTGLVASSRRPAPEGRPDRWRTMIEAHIGPMPLRHALAIVTGSATIGAVIGLGLFGPGLPGLACAVAGGGVGSGRLRAAHESRRDRTAEAWPRILDEVRVLIGAAGRSIPQALFEAGRHAPGELGDAFAAAEREWKVSTDFERATGVLKHLLADATADVTCETLLVAHEVGGIELGTRLDALVEDRSREIQGRKDARARQAGARFSRRFVVAVPIAMALAGMSIGDGRRAYATAGGQLWATVALAMVAGCWWWAGRILRLPPTSRVFVR